MAVRIRLTRQGRRHHPFYRVVAIDSRNHREGRAKEILGTYDPHPADKNIQVNIDQVHAWIRNGAQLSEGVRSLLKHAGYQPVPQETVEAAEKRRNRRAAQNKTRQKKDGKKWAPPSRRARLAHQKKLKQERLAAQEEALSKHRAAKEAAAAKEAEAEAPAEEASSEGGES